jgi:uncharacterized protein (DUF305 family)
MRKVLWVLAATLALASLSSCSSWFGGSDNVKQGNAIEQAFLQSMVPHHQTAIDMANMALDMAQIQDVHDMAQDVVDAQSAEITQMGQIHQRLFGTALVPDEMAHDALGLTMAEAGMDMSMDDLEGADPFDMDYIDMMIHHHQGAIRMARVLLRNTTDTELTALANSIITAQSAEIVSMNQLRLEQYGAESPSGGVPPEGE